MRILITGGKGFVATGLVDHWRAGRNIFAPSSTDLNVLDIKSLESYVSNVNPDVLIHTAQKGHFGSQPTYEDFVDNIKMFENIREIWKSNKPLFVIGSGAEFDRRYPIDRISEEKIFDSYPIDLYGLGKNIISRRTLEEIPNGYVLRLFGCFGPHEKEFRFFKRSITRVLNNQPIEIDQDREFDFFYVEDVGTTIDYLLKNGGPKNINLVYNQKHTLLSLAKLIKDCTYHSVHPCFSQEPQIKTTTFGMPYTGDSFKLTELKVDLRGLTHGIYHFMAHWRFKMEQIKI